MPVIVGQNLIGRKKRVELKAPTFRLSWLSQIVEDNPQSSATMTPLSPLRANASRRKPAKCPLDWIEEVQLSPDELTALREHVERLLHLDEEVQR